jgi:peptidoglycan LD-endopeptidase CwlK
MPYRTCPLHCALTHQVLSGVFVQINDMIRAVQKKLKVQEDGKAGTETWGAIYAALVKPKIAGLEPALAIAQVDARSEGNIATLLDEVQPIARALVQKAAAAGINIKVISGSRSYAEQDALYAKGRTAPGPKVTNAPGGYSNHNFGIAFDIGVFSGNSYLQESPKYKAVGVLGMDLGLEWGGNWTSIVDQPHFQLRPVWAGDLTEREMLAELRRRVGGDEPVYA